MNVNLLVISVYLQACFVDCVPVSVYSQLLSLAVCALLHKKARFIFVDLFSLQSPKVKMLMHSF